MTELLQSIPTWVYGPIAVLVAAVIATATALYVNRKKKRIWYSAEVYPVVGKGLSSRIQVSLNGKILPNVYVCAVSLLYKGTEPLLEEDFRTPITLEFEDSKVLDVEVTDTEPTGIRATVYTNKDSEFRFDPVALNDNSRLYARVLLTRRALPKISAHIIGVKLIQHESQRDNLLTKAMTFALASMFLGVILMLLGIFLSSPDELHPIGIFGFGIMVFSLLTTTAAISFILVRSLRRG